MTDPQVLGRDGEDSAVVFLRKNGYKILHRNWKSGKKEIDIVAENSDFIVFVEVKTRSSKFLSQAPVTVPKEKQRLLLLAAESYIQRYNINKESRFDIVTIVTNGKTEEIEHTIDAFYATLK